MKFRFSPTLFIIFEIIFLFSSCLYLLALASFVITGNSYIYALVISKSFLQNVLSLIISPVAGGFLAYQYLERYKAKGKIGVLAKTILAYTIMEIGLIVVFFLFRLIKLV